MSGESLSLYCKLYYITQNITVCLCLLSLFHLALIAMERYLAMKYSLRYEAIVTRFRLTVAIACCWLITKVYFVPRLRIIPGVKVITATSKIWNPYFASDYFLSCFRLFCLSSAYDPDQIGTSFQRGHNKVSGGKKSLENNHYYY